MGSHWQGKGDLNFNDNSIRKKWNKVPGRLVREKESYNDK